MRVASALLILALTGAGCGKSGDTPGSGPTKPAPDAPGVGEQPTTRVSEENVGKQPTQGAPAGDTRNAEAPTDPAMDNRDSLGTTHTPEGVGGGDGGVTPTPSERTAQRTPRTPRPETNRGP